MPNAQDQAFALLIARRGLLTPEQLAGADARWRTQAAGRSLAAHLQELRLLSPETVAGVQRELSQFSYCCQRCGAPLRYGDLSRQETLQCPVPQCGGTLERAQQPSPPPVAPLGLESDEVDVVDPVSAAYGDSVLPSLPLPTRAVREDVPPTIRERANASTQAGRGPGSTEPLPRRSPSASYRQLQADGRNLGPYVIEDELGRGAHGVVYLARRRGLERRYALKVLKDSGLADEETVARFRLEAAVGSKIEDEGVLSVYDVGRDGDYLYYAMEYCAGPTLKVRLREGALAPEEAAELLLRIARTMEAVHGKGVIHRDLKPSNIILEEGTGKPKVTDFGLARDHSLLKSMTQTGDVLGTPYYMAPEQFRGQRDLDHRIDVYAMGVILYECITGQRPHDATTPMMLAERVCHADPTPPREIDPEVPAPLEAISLCAMARDPEQRYPTAAALGKDLERFLRGEQTAAGRRPMRWGLALFALAILGLGVAVAAFAAYQAGASDERPAPPPPEVSRRLESARATLADVRQQLDQGGARIDRAQLDRLAGRLGEAHRQGRGDDPLLAEIARQQRRLDGRRDLAEVERLARAKEPFKELRPLLERAERAAQGDPRLLQAVQLAGVAARVRRGRSQEALRLVAPLLLASGAVGLEARRLKALALEGLGRTKEARSSYVELAQGDPGGPRGLTAQAATKRLDGELRAGADALANDEVLGTYQPALVERGLCLVGLKEIGGADFAFTRARELRPDDPRVFIGLGRLRLLEGKLELAQHMLTQARRLLERDFSRSVQLTSGLVFMKRGRAEEALKAFDAILARDPQEVETLVHRGGLLRRRAQTSKGTKDWRAAHKIDAARARAVMERWYTAEQLEDFEAAIRPQPTNPFSSGWPLPPIPKPTAAGGVTLGTISAKTKANLANRVHGLEDPLRSDVLAGLAAAAAGKQWGKIAHPVNRALRMDAEQPVVVRERLRLLVGRDRVGEARKALVAARALSKIDRLELARLGAELAWRAGDLRAALRAFDALAQEDPRGARGLTALAQAYLLRGRYDRARVAARSALRVSPRYAPAWIVNGLSSAALNKYADAKRSAAQAYELEGACDSALLALLAAVKVELELSARLARFGRVAGFLQRLVQDEEHFGLSEGTFCRRLAARITLESKTQATRRWGRAVVDVLAKGSPSSAAVALLHGYASVVLGERAYAVVRWGNAHKLDPKLPFPAHYLQRYRKAFNTSEGIEQLLKKN